MDPGGDRVVAVEARKLPTGNAYPPDPGIAARPVATFLVLVRHPNYFSTAPVYVCITRGRQSLSAQPDRTVVMFAFLYRVSGIPWVEAQSLRSRGENYEMYQRQVSAFFPWPPRHD